jgi:hypothetical protein
VNSKVGQLLTKQISLSVRQVLIAILAFSIGLAVNGCASSPLPVTPASGLYEFHPNRYVTCWGTTSCIPNIFWDPEAPGYIGSKTK